MKLIKAYIRTYMADKVIQALEKIGAPRLTVIDIRTKGDEIDPQYPENASDQVGTYTTMVKLEIVCAEKEVERITKIIVKNARTGYKGDGIIVMSPVEKVTKIRTGKIEES